MKSPAIALIVLFTCAGVCQAGEPARGKVCDYDPHGFEPDANAPGTYYGGRTMSCANIMYDWPVGGNTGNPAGKVTIHDVAPDRAIEGCEKGRQMQAYITYPGTSQSNWVRERFLRCP